MDTLDVFDRISEGEKVVLTQSVERDPKAPTEESEQVVLVPDFEGQPGPQGLAQQTLNRHPIAEGMSVRPWPPRPARRRRWRGRACRTFAGCSGAGARASSPYRPRRNTVAPDPLGPRCRRRPRRRAPPPA